MKDLSKKAVDIYGGYLNERDYEGRTLDHLAAMIGDTKKLKVCKRAEVDMEAKDNYSLTPVHLAAINGHTETVKYLIEEAKVNLDVEDENGMTPLYYAIKYGKFETAELLVEAGANPNIMNKDGKTVLDLVNYLESEGYIMKKIKDSLIKAGAKTGKQLDEEEKKQKVPKKAPSKRKPKVCDREIKSKTRKNSIRKKSIRNK